MFCMCSNGRHVYVSEYKSFFFCRGKNIEIYRVDSVASSPLSTQKAVIRHVDFRISLSIAFYPGLLPLATTKRGM